MIGFQVTVKNVGNVFLRYSVVAFKGLFVLVNFCSSVYACAHAFVGLVF